MNKNLFKVIILAVLVSMLLVFTAISCKKDPVEVEEPEIIETETTYTETIVETTPEPEVTTPEEREPEFVEYTVKEGDTLSQIAKKFYGYDSPPYWELIFKANKDILKDASLIYPGQVIRIPELPDEMKKD